MMSNTGTPAITTILYVDDEPALLDIGKMFLEEDGSFTVDTSLSGPDALARLSSRKYDAIVSDYQMPRMDGIAFLKALRAQGDTTPFIIFTGRGREDVVIEALNSGADFYLQKGGEPVSQFAELAHKILHAISRKQADLALKKREQEYRHLIEHAGEAIFVTQDEVFRLINPQLIKNSGYSEQELINQPFTRFVHPDDVNVLLENFRMRIAGSNNLPSHYIFRILRKDGTIRWVELNVVSITWDDQPAILNFMTDITERKLAQDALRESEERYRQFFRTTLDGLFITTPDGQWIDFNDAIVGMFGCRSRDEVFSSPIISFYENPEDRAAIVQRVEREGYVKEYPLSYRRRDGVIFDALMTVTAHKNPDGSTRLFIGTLRDITERKRIEDALRESEDRYRQFFKTTLDGLFITTPEGQLIDFNDAIVELLGYASREEVFSTPIISLYVHPEDRVAFVERVERDGYVKEYPVQLTKRDGTIIDTQMTVTLQRNSDGSTKALIGTIRDITERKQAESALRESEDRYRIVTQMITDFVWDWNTSTGSVQWFGDIDTALGYPPGEFPRAFDAWETRVHPDDHDRIMNAIHRSIDSGERFDEEYRIMARDGTWRHFHDRGSTIADAEGTRVRMIGAVTDITERRNIEESLRESEERYRRIFESFEDLYYQTDTNGIVTILSPSLNRLTGWTEKELIGSSITKIYVNPEDRQVLLNELAEKGYVRDYEVLLRMQDGRETPVSLSANRIFHPDGTPAGVAGILRDITRRKRAEDALKESEVKFRSLVDHALEAILIIDMQGKVLFANNAAARTVDAENSADLIGRNVMEVIAPESRDNVATDLKEVARGNDAFLCRYNLISMKGRSISVECIGKMIMFEGKPADLISLRDVTGQKQ